MKSGTARSIHYKLILSSLDGMKKGLARFGHCLLEQLTRCVDLHSEDLNDQDLCRWVRMCKNNDNTIFLIPTNSNDPRAIPIAHSSTCPTLIHPTNTPDTNRIRIAIAVVIERIDGSVLLTKRPSSMGSFPNTWVIPGGHIEFEETLEEAVQREVLEEIGLDDLRDVEILGLWESVYPPIFSQKPPFRQHLVIYYSAKTMSCMIQPNDQEITEYAWLTPFQAISLVYQSNMSLHVSVTRVSGRNKVQQLIPLERMRSDPERRSGTTQGTLFALAQNFRDMRTDQLLITDT